MYANLCIALLEYWIQHVLAVHFRAARTGNEIFFPDKIMFLINLRGKNYRFLREKWREAMHGSDGGRTTTTNNPQTTTNLFTQQTHSHPYYFWLCNFRTVTDTTRP